MELTGYLFCGVIMSYLVISSVLSPIQNNLFRSLWKGQMTGVQWTSGLDLQSTKCVLNREFSPKYKFDCIGIFVLLKF